MMERLLARGNKIETLKFFPNWVDEKVIFPMESINYYRNNLVLGPEKIVALYSGNLGKKQGIDLLLDVAACLEKNPEILFVICGEGSEKDELIGKACGLRNVIFLPLQPIDKLNELLSSNTSRSGSS